LRVKRVLFEGATFRKKSFFLLEENLEVSMLKPVDSKGNRTGSYFSMLVYYGGDEKSRDVIRTYPLSECTIVPCVRITIMKNDARSASIVFVYPAENLRSRIQLSDRAINGLRALAKNPRGGWKVENEITTVEFWKPGCVLPPDSRAGGFPQRPGGAR
jgi:hypothetical protein